MDWFKKHIDTFVIIGCVLSGFKWADTKFEKADDNIKIGIEKINQRLEKVDEYLIRVDQKLHFAEREIDIIHGRINERFSILENEMQIFKAVMLMKNILPAEFAQQKE